MKTNMETLQVITEKQASVTTTHSHKFEMEWSILRFEDRMKDIRESKKSICAYFTSGIGDVWKLSVCSEFVYNIDYDRYIPHYTFCMSCNNDVEGEIITKCTIELKDTESGELFPTSIHADVVEEHVYYRNRESDNPDVVMWKADSEDFTRMYKKEHGFLPNDTLTTVWTVKTLQRQNLNSNDNLQNFTNQLDLERDLFPDIKFVTGNQSFNAHKVILAAKSSVFRAMFNSNMIETHKDEVDMSQYRPTAVRIMLDYIYTGKYAQLYAKEVLQLADMYDIPGLKFAAEAELILSLKPECAAKYMHHGDLFQSPKLKAAAIAYIKLNKHLLIENEAHKDYVDLHGELFKAISDIFISSNVETETV